jgi:hypothetical protein
MTGFEQAITIFFLSGMPLIWHLLKSQIWARLLPPVMDGFAAVKSFTLT